MNLAGASIWYLQQADRAVVNVNLTDEQRNNLKEKISEIKADMDRAISLASAKEHAAGSYGRDWH